MATIDLKLKSYDELQFEIMRLNTDNYLKQQHIDQLTNNWNELEEWVRILIDDNNNRYELYKDDKLHYEYEISNIKYQNNMLIAFLDKMKEIKENHHDPN